MVTGGGSVVGAAVVVGAVVVVGVVVVGGDVVVGEVVGAAAERVTAMAYVVLELPETELTAKEMFSVAPSATDKTSVSDDIAMVPDVLVRLMAAPDALAIAVKVTDADAFGMVSE